MKILFVTDRVCSENDPNLNLIKAVSPYLEKDAQVCFMGHDADPEKAGEMCFFFCRDEKVRELFFSLSGLSAPQKIAQLIRHPLLSFWGAFKVFNIDLITLPYVRMIQKLDKKYHFDAIISISAPFYTAKALARVNTRAKKIIMMFDPYGQHSVFGNRRTRLMEKRAFAKTDGVFVPKLLKKHYPDAKVKTYEFPAVVPVGPQITEPLYDPTKINLAFVGSLYADIRSPEYLYELLKTLGDDRYHLTIVGGTYGVFPREFHEKYSDFINEHVTIVGKVTKEKALQYLWQADVLVNIGNRVENMLPSKVLEYISTGKPVLNIAQLENCPSLPYFEKYGNAMNIYSGKPATDEQLQQLRRFLEERSTVPEEKIRKDFYDATPEYVAKQLIEMVK